MKNVVKTTIAALALAGAQYCIADGEFDQKTVSYAGLDLSQPAGAKILHHRLSYAAKQVCSAIDTRRAHTGSAHRQCVAKALSDAVASINRPMLTQYHESKHKDYLPRVASR